MNDRDEAQPRSAAPRDRAIDAGEGISETKPAGRSRLADLFQAEHRRMLRYARGRLRDDEQARDVVQDAFVRLAATPLFDEIRSPIAYLRRTVANLLKDQAKTGNRRGAHKWVEVDEDLLPPVPPDQEWGLAADALRARYEAALATMPAPARRVFLLHRVDELPYKAIAARLEIAMSTVEYHMARALVHLDKALRDD